jgi:hypothetical protein
MIFSKHRALTRTSHIDSSFFIHTAEDGKRFFQLAPD